MIFELFVLNQPLKLAIVLITLEDHCDAVSSTFFKIVMVYRGRHLKVLLFIKLIKSIANINVCFNEYVLMLRAG